MEEAMLFLALIYSFCTANPQDVVDRAGHGHNLWETRGTTQEDFFIFFSSADSAACRGFLLKI
jgi:hypothetical protein